MIVDDFRKMIETNKAVFTDDELGLFHDSMRCFNAGIYRPAYILAYQGVMIYFRRMLQNADIPTSFDSNAWQAMQAHLRGDKEWEEEVNNAIRKRPNPRATPPELAILSMPESIRKDFDYWRNRRNDCAHYKEYNINDSHVMAFYSFLTQYFLSISVEGGMLSLLNEISNHCDPTKTDPNEPIQPLIDKILVMVMPDEMDSFFGALEGAMGYRFDGRYEKTMAEIIKGNNKELRDYAIRFVRKEGRLKIDIINRYPDLVGHLIDKTEAREFWMTNLKGCRNRMAVLSCMMMVGLIKNTEKKDALTKMITYAFDNNEGMGEISEDRLDILRSESFFGLLRDEYFNSGFTSRNARLCGKQKFDFFRGFMQYIPIDKEWIESLVDIFSQPNYPTVWLDIYKELYLSKDEYKTQFDKVVNDNGIIVPSYMLS